MTRLGTKVLVGIVIDGIDQEVDGAVTEPVYCPRGMVAARRINAMTIG